MSRPTKLTKELQKSICDDVEKTGATFERAAEANGIHRATLYNWRKWGADGRQPYADFFDAITRAHARYEIEVLRKLENPELSCEDPKAMGPLVRSLTWKLERTRRDTYGSHITVKVTEAQNHFLEKLSEVCDRMGAEEVLGAFLDELEASSPEVEDEESATSVH